MRASSRPESLFQDRHGALARVAQLVEQRIENPRVGGSNPPPGTTGLHASRAQILLAAADFDPVDHLRHDIVLFEPAVESGRAFSHRAIVDVVGPIA